MKEFFGILGTVILVLVIISVLVVLPILAFEQSSKGNKECAAKHGTTEVIWSYPDKCYVKKG